MNGLLLAILLLQTPATLQNQYGILTGRVRQSDEPVPAIRIAAMAVPDTANASGVLVSLTETDADGRFRLENVPPGRYYIIAGRVDFPTYYPGTTNITGAGIVEVTARRVVEDIDFNLPRGTDLKGLRIQVAAQAQVTGRLVTENGSAAPLKGMIQFRSPGGMWGRPLANGVFASTLPEDEYAVSLSMLPPGYIVKSIRYGGTDITQGLMKLEASAGPKEIVVTLGTVPFSSVEVSGRLTVSGPGLSLELAGQGGAESPAPIMVKEDGTFEFPGVLPGHYLVRLTGASLDPISENLVVKNVDLVGLVIRTKPVARVVGRVDVLDAAGNKVLPPASLLVRFQQPRGSTQAPVVGSTFGLDLVEGEHTVTLNLPPGYSIKSLTSGALDLKYSQLKITGANRPPDIQILLEYVPPARMDKE